MIGSSVGPYRIVAPLGAGGMGEVYRARDDRLGRDVAIKMLPKEFAVDPDRLRRFEQEARTTAALNHPNILAIHDVGSHEGQPYLVEELLQGESLRERLRGGASPVGKVVDLGVQIASGLAAAHEKGIVHRDLKPENVFVTKDGHVKILDFGLAKLRESKPLEARITEVATEQARTVSGAVLGTVGYMAPEQVRGQAADHRADIFALGCVLYEMLSGQRAFKGETAADTMSAILSKDTPALSCPGREIPPVLQSIVGRCLEKNPEDRFQSARDLAFDLGLLSGVSAPQLAPVELPRWRLKPRWLALGAALAVLIGLLVLAAVLGRRTATQRVPSFSRLTFRQGYVAPARFEADGETIVYAAQWEDKTRRLYLKRPDAPEALPLELSGVASFSVSRRGEVALVLGSGVGSGVVPGVLARAPLSGGAPRAIVASVTFAEWTPDGAELAVVRSQEGRRRLEFPLGNVLYETAGTISSPCFSPNGELIAFANHPYPMDDRGWVAVVDRSGKVRTLTAEWASVRGLAWSPGGDEIWFAASEPGYARALYAVTTAGRLRVLLRAPGDLMLFDVSSSGRALVAREDSRFSILASVGGEEKERDLTWLGHGVPVDISADGKILLFVEMASVVGPEYAVCLRRTDGSPPVVLGKGRAMALSPDGAWALASLPSPEAPLQLLPTGPGEAKQVRLPGISHRNGVFFPDGRSILIEGYRAGRSAQLYQVSLDGGPPRAVTPEGIFPFGGIRLTISPDGQWVGAVGVSQHISLYPVAGGERRELPSEHMAVPIRWSADGKAVLIWERGEPAMIVRVDVSTGQRVVIKELVPSDPLAQASAYTVITPDEKSYACAYSRRLSELYLVEGLR
jgi:hypothetical protein